MPWVDGSSLNDWAERNLGKPAAFRRLRGRIKDLAEDMENRGVAHGDLQHGNILVREDDTVVLIDYDGMFVPELAGKPMLEGGHKNYQHPDRPRAKFGPEIDRFSFAIIWSALEVLERAPDLWALFDNGENMLFRAADFADAASSPLLQALRRDSVLAPIADRVTRLASAPVSDVPSLADVLLGRLPVFLASPPIPVFD